MGGEGLTGTSGRARGIPPQSGWRSAMTLPGKDVYWSGLTGLLLLLAPLPARAEAVMDFLQEGRVIFDTRLRYENVSQDGFAASANAATIRERLGFETPAFANIKLLFELQATQHLSGAFNDTVTGRASYPQIPDPETFSLNRLQAAYNAPSGLNLTLGRQIINLDDQRFVGASAFRQNEQTFDAARLDYNGFPSLGLTYAYSSRVNRVFGERSPNGHFNADIHLFNAGYVIADLGRVSAFTYLLDLHRNPALSTATYGLQFTGASRLQDDLRLRYALGYAHQAPYAGNLQNFSLNYWRLEAGMDYGDWSVTAGSETLGGNGTIGFSTPLATLHAFQGDADVFLTTPSQGVADRYAKVSYQTSFSALGGSRSLNLSIAYHQYEGAGSSIAMGHEIDLGAGLKLTDHWRLDLIHAVYDGGGSGFASRDKTWLSLTVNY